MREFEQNMSTVRYFLGKGREIHYIFGAILYIWCDIHDKDQGLVSYFQLWDIFIAKRGNDIIFLGAIFYVGRLAKWHLLTLADSLTATKDRNQVLHKMQISQRFVKTSKNKSNFWSRPCLIRVIEDVNILMNVRLWKNFSDLHLAFDFLPHSWNGLLLLTGETDDMTGDYLALLLRWSWSSSFGKWWQLTLGKPIQWYERRLSSTLFTKIMRMMMRIRLEELSDNQLLLFSSSLVISGHLRSSLVISYHL